MDKFGRGYVKLGRYNNVEDQVGVSLAFYYPEIMYGEALVDICHDLFGHLFQSVDLFVISNYRVHMYYQVDIEVSGAVPFNAVYDVM